MHPACTHAHGHVVANMRLQQFTGSGQLESSLGRGAAGTSVSSFEASALTGAASVLIGCTHHRQIPGCTSCYRGSEQLLMHHMHTREPQRRMSS